MNIGIIVLYVFMGFCILLIPFFIIGFIMEQRNSKYRVHHKAEKTSLERARNMKSKSK